MTPADGRQTALFSVWGAEQAIQFETSWWTWGDVGRVHASLRTALADRSVPDNVPIGIVMRQRPALKASDLVGLTPAVVIAHTIDWGRPGFSDAVHASGALGLEIADDFQMRAGADGDSASA